jgi:hypothetical protein
VFLGALRKGLGHQVILDIPRRMGVGFARQPGTRVWFTVLGSTLLVTGQPFGQRGERRYSSRLVRSYLPLKLLLQNREMRTSYKRNQIASPAGLAIFRAAVYAAAGKLSLNPRAGS